MSLISLATRVALCRLLRDRTWAADRIFDQPIDPIAEVARSMAPAQKPCIAVYSGESKGRPVGLESQAGKQAVRIFVYVYLPPSKIETPAHVTFEIDNIGSGLALDTIGRQVDAAMHSGGAEWVAVWRGFVLRIEDKTSRFVLVETERGVKIPCLEIQYDFECVADAEIGKPLYGTWLKLDALLRADGSGSEGEMLADHLKALVENPVGLLPFEQFQANFALTDAAFNASGIAPLATTDDGDAPTLANVGGDPEIEVHGPGAVP